MQCNNSMVQFDFHALQTAEVPIVIFGAKTVGEAIYYECMTRGVKVTCFCDNFIEFTNKKKFGLTIFHPDALKNRFDDAIFIISACDIQDVIAQLVSIGYSKWYPGGLLLNSFDVTKYPFSASYDFVEYTVSSAILSHEGYMHPDKVYLRSLDIIITEKCSLKCADCSNLAQYYDNPKDDNINDILASLDAFCHYIDKVNEVRVIGGEPFMNKDIYAFLVKLIEIDKIRKVLIFTNGTILPRSNYLEILGHEKILLIITDYGALSKNYGALIRICEENRIAYYSEVANGWTDCATIQKHERSVEELKSIFKRCCAKNLFTLSKGKVFRCPFAANVDRLGASPKFKGDYINVFARPTKQDYKRFFLEKSFLEVCDYCNGRFFTDPVIKPATQLNKPLHYTKYG